MSRRRSNSQRFRGKNSSGFRKKLKIGESRFSDWVGKDVTGVIRFISGGRGVFLPESSELPSIKLYPEELEGVFNGDRISITIEMGRNGKLRGKFSAIKERGDGVLVGSLRRQGHAAWVDTQPRRLKIRVDDPGGRVKNGEAVIVKILHKESRNRALRGTIIEILGPPEHPKVAVEMAILAQGITLGYPIAACDEAEAFADVDPIEVLEEGRRDLRDVLHITIDGADARDFDDAVACRMEGGTCRLWVSIADVSAYVREGTALDEEAARRSTSIYFPHKAIHMLPPALSTELCSLKPDVPRLAMTVEMLIGATGIPTEVSAYPSLIQSGGRLTYAEVESALEGDRLSLASDNPCRKKAIYELVRCLSRVAKWFRNERFARGCMDLDLPERQIVLGEDGVAARIEERSRLESHRLIEDLMIAANEAVARYLLKRQCPGVYRIHEPPDQERLSVVAKWAELFGHKLDLKSDLNPRELAKFASELGGDERTSMGQVLLLRSMKQARYGVDNHGHFGLASEAYLHFTSPIRRYPDLLVHRALKKLWSKQGAIKDLDSAASHASVQERAAMLAERDVTDLMACQIAMNFIGDVMKANVVSVLKSGVFVRGEKELFEGFVSIDELNEFYHEYFEFVEESIMLLGGLTARQITIGNQLTVRLESVNVAERLIDFQLVGGFAKRRGKGGDSDSNSSARQATRNRRAVPVRKKKVAKKNRKKSPKGRRNGGRGRGR